MSEYADKLRSLHFSRPGARGPKVTRDVHYNTDANTPSHTVDVTEHWDDRVDVTVHAPTVHLDLSQRGDANG